MHADKAVHRFRRHFPALYIQQVFFSSPNIHRSHINRPISSLPKCRNQIHSSPNGGNAEHFAFHFPPEYSLPYLERVFAYWNMRQKIEPLLTLALLFLLLQCLLQSKASRTSLASVLQYSTRFCRAELNKYLVPSPFPLK